MNNTTLGCVAIDFEHTLMAFGHANSFRKNSGVNYCTKMSYIRCWRCTERWIHQITRPFSYHQHSSEDISKQITADDLISSGPFSGVA